MIQKNLLDGATIYLSGSMEMAKDHGVGWRRNFIRLVENANLPIKCIDPTNKPGPAHIKMGEEKGYQERLQQEGRFEELRSYVHSYRRFDLRFVDLSDAIVCVIDPDISHWGTPNEIYLAESQHKPIFCIIEGGLSRLPRWLFDVIPFENIFEDLESCVNRLESINQGLYPMCDKWVLIRKYL